MPKYPTGYALISQNAFTEPKTFEKLKLPCYQTNIFSEKSWNLYNAGTNSTFSLYIALYVTFDVLFRVCGMFIELFNSGLQEGRLFC